VLYQDTSTKLRSSWRCAPSMPKRKPDTIRTSYFETQKRQLRVASEKTSRSCLRLTIDNGFRDVCARITFSIPNRRQFSLMSVHSEKRNEIVIRRPG